MSSVQPNMNIRCNLASKKFTFFRDGFCTLYYPPASPEK